MREDGLNPSSLILIMQTKNFHHKIQKNKNIDDEIEKEEVMK
jgi:hypothetical protein